MSELIDRQEAIDRFNVIRPADKKKDEYTKGIDVGIAMCIVAVKDQPTIQPVATDTNVGDTISRQAAIDAAKDWYEGLICGSINGLIKRLNALPTIQPQSTTGQLNDGARSTAQSTDLIDRQAAIDGKISIQRANGVEIYSDEAVPVEYLKRLPTIQPEQCGDKSYTLWKESYEELKRRMDELTSCSDIISRQAAIDALDFEIVHMTAYCDGKNEGNPLAQYNKGLEDGKKAIEALPTAQPELTDEQAITHLQSSGWMQRHDKEMYESGLKEYLADDSDSYDSLLPSAQPEPKEGHWIPVTNGRGGHECDRCHEYAPSYQSGNEHLSKYCPNCGAKMTKHQSIYHRSTYHYPHGTGLCGQYGSRNGQVRKERFRDQLRASLRPRSCGVSYVTDHQD